MSQACEHCSAPIAAGDVFAEREWEMILCSPCTRHAIDLLAQSHGEPDACTHPNGHDWECTGSAYGGDDDRWHGEGRMLCVHCGADGDG